MNDVINNFLLTGDKFIPKMHLRQPQLNHSACGPSTKNKQKIQRFMKTGETNYIKKE